MRFGMKWPVMVAMLAASANALALPVDSSVTLTKIGFGSCNFQRGPKDHWAAINAQKPQLWIWGGDNIYADHLWESAREGEYAHLKSTPGYKTLRSNAMIVGTWDDHDYGFNNTGKTYKGKDASQKMMLDFLDEPEDSPRRKQKGAYTSYQIGPSGKEVKIILLDLRYFRDKPGEDSELMGEAQWDWLERELFTDNAPVTFLVSSTQLVPRDSQSERWAQYPKERNRMVRLIDAFLKAGKGRQQFFVLSGDVHMAELSKVTTPGGFELFELTSSGLSHSHIKTSVKNRYRVGPMIGERNFSMIEIDWARPTPLVKVEVLSHEGKPLLSKKLASE